MSKASAASGPRRSTESLPRYLEVASELEAGIANQTYPVGSVLPTEHELCDAYGISRFTVREALRQLSTAGLVTRKPRLGTLVVSRTPRHPYTQSIESIDDLLQYSSDTEMRLIEQSRVSVKHLKSVTTGVGFPVDPGLIGTRSWIHALGVRHRRGDALPICISRVYLNPLLKGIAARMAAQPGAIYRLIEAHYGVRIARVEQRFMAGRFEREDAARLRTAASTPALRVLRYYFDDRENCSSYRIACIRSGGSRTR